MLGEMGQRFPFFVAYFLRQAGRFNPLIRKPLLEVLEKYKVWRSQFLDEAGELKPRFQPGPMVASFMQEPAVAQREQIPVPKGPVEVW